MLLWVFEICLGHGYDAVDDGIPNHNNWMTHKGHTAPPKMAQQALSSCLPAESNSFQSAAAAAARAVFSAYLACFAMYVALASFKFNLPTCTYEGQSVCHIDFASRKPIFRHVLAKFEPPLHSLGHQPASPPATPTAVLDGCH